MRRARSSPLEDVMAIDKLKEKADSSIVNLVNDSANLQTDVARTSSGLIRTASGFIRIHQDS